MNMNMNDSLLISYVTSLVGRPLEHEDIEVLQEKIKNCFPPPQESVGASEAIVCELLDAMQNCRKINAIKAYRAMTGVGLKEAKDAVERYWQNANNNNTRLSDILGE